MKHGLVMCGILIAFALSSTIAVAQQTPQEPEDEEAAEQPRPQPVQQVQPDEPSPFQLGVVGLGNLATFMGDDTEGLAPKVGFGGGLRAIVPFNEYIGLQPEVLLNQRGTAFDEIDDSYINLNYLQVPILARVTLPTNGPVTPKLLIGPTLGGYLGGTTQINGQQFDLDDEAVSFLDVGGAAGLGADIAVGPGSVSIDGRYNLGFVDVTDDADNTFNSAVDLLLGYNFRF